MSPDAQAFFRCHDVAHVVFGGVVLLLGLEKFYEGQTGRL
jgi:hypothetical protein